VRAAAVTVAFTMLFVAAAAASALVSIRNVRIAKKVSTQPPFDEAEILAATPLQRKVPPGWPEPTTLGQQRVAAAYRDYARDHADTRTLEGELMILVAGAALGASIGDAMHGGWHVWPPSLALVLGAFGVMVRQFLPLRWTKIATRYERRRTELVRQAAAPITPRRRRWFGR
jgi:hypothetical protein